MTSFISKKSEPDFWDAFAVHSDYFTPSTQVLIEQMDRSVPPRLQNFAFEYDGKTDRISIKAPSDVQFQLSETLSTKLGLLQTFLEVLMMKQR